VRPPDSAERTLRTFDIAVLTAEGLEFDLELDLPIVWARRHETVVVAFERQDREFGWHAYVLGEDGAVLLGFPWHDHADTSLAGSRLWRPSTWFRIADSFPLPLPAEGWDDLEQGWWGSVVPDGDRVFVAETDFDEITDRPLTEIEPREPGIVVAGGVPILWSCTPRRAWDRAWEDAIASCRRGRPSPVGSFDPESGRFVLRG